MAERVRQEVEEHAFDLLGGHADGVELGAEPRCEGHVARLGFGLERAQAGVDERPEGRVAQLERERAGVDRRELEEVVDEPGKVLHLFADRGQILLRGCESVLERFEHRPQ